LHIFTLAFDCFENLVHSFWGSDGLLGWLVDQSGQLLQLVSMQKVNIHHVDEGATIFKLFLSLIELSVKSLNAVVPKRLGNSLHKSLKSEREWWAHPLQHITVPNRRQLSPYQQRDKVLPRLIIMDQLLTIITCLCECVPQLLLVVDGRL
jgi:hypothetical protein